MQRTEDIRAQQREGWSGAAPGWARHVDDIGGMTRPVTDQMLEMLGLRPGERVLDLAGGVGDPALAIAEAVGPEGRVLGLDLTPAMVEVARARAAERGLRNVEFRAIDSETELGVGDGSFDAATCRFGLMFVPDPVATLEAVRAALRPEGRLVVSTWGPDDRNPMGAFRMRIVGRHVPEPQGTQYASWSLVNSIDGLEGVLLEAGFDDLETVTVEVLMGGGSSPEEFWERESRVSIALQTSLAPLDEELRAAIRADAIRELRAMFPDGRVEFPGEALVSRGISGG